MTESTTTTLDSYPPIPRASWVTERYTEDDGAMVVDEHAFVDGGFAVLRGVTHVRKGDGYASTEEHYCVSWDSAHPDGVAANAVQIYASEIPGIISLLNRLARRGDPGQMLAADGIPLIDSIIKLFSDAGYTIDWNTVFDAVASAAPKEQTRELRRPSEVDEHLRGLDQ